ncbi:helix-turn-helix domain-containing protein [Legionella bozemanae]|uniref:Putative Antitoxin higA-2 n=1 Tax=Legionella bozemanae TaxID=447 RepID=A0A0W0S1C5_LEGBO|nr:helix-turn-helix domain-containing protein [Legionella bozemanae]KTC77271.1 putative Antitoxin higA-2 [Legionella bozemanae]STO34925.1 putative zinc finger/helix-turn-helix protein, YgiT family [Legionella bozemanae]
MSELGKSLIQGVEEALEYAKQNKNGAITHKIEVPSVIDVSAIRKELHMSRQKFSEEFGFSIRTVEKWERGERLPEGPTRAYLTVIDRNPHAVIEALRKAS